MHIFLTVQKDTVPDTQLSVLLDPMKSMVIYVHCLVSCTSLLSSDKGIICTIIPTAHFQLVVSFLVYCISWE